MARGSLPPVGQPAALTIAELSRILDAFKKHVASNPAGHIDGAFEGGREDGHRDGRPDGGRHGDARQQKAGGIEGGSIYGEADGGRFGKIRWEPKGAIALTPQQDRYVEGAAIGVELVWDLSVHPRAALIRESGACEYAWDLIREDAKDGRPQASTLFSQRDSSSLTLGDPGAYAIVATARSGHFKPDALFTTRRIVNVITEEQADRKAFDANHTRGPEATFDRDGAGALRTRPGQSARTVKQEIDALDLARGGIVGLAKQHKILESDREVLEAQLDKQRLALVAIDERTRAATPYVVRGSFTSREDSTSLPLRLFMHAVTRSGMAGIARVEVMLHDTTLGEAHQHPGDASGAAPEPSRVMPAVERAALDDMASHFHAHNDYAKGTIHLAAQQLTSETVWEKTLDTNNTRKKAKRVFSTIAMVGGATLTFVPGGSVVGVPLMTVTAVSGAAAIALEIEDRVAKEGTLKLDRRLAMDVVQLASTALPFGALSKTFAAATSVAKSRFYLCMVGLDVAQGFMIAADVRHQLELIDANTAVALANAATDDQRAAIRNERDRQVSELLGGALVNGAFVVVSLAGNLKTVAATSRAGRTFDVRSPVADLMKRSRDEAREAIASGSFQHGKERIELTANERAYIEHDLATPTSRSDSPPATDRLAELRAQLPPDLSDVPLRQSGSVDGAGVRVTYKDGEVCIEVGPTAEPRHVRYHIGAARQLLKFHGPLGFVRRLIHTALTKLRLTPGFGTSGFEARLEVKKLNAILADLRASQARLGERAAAAERGEHADFDREIAEITEQLEHHQTLVDSYDPGRGFVAAEGKGKRSKSEGTSKEPKSEATPKVSRAAARQAKAQAELETLLRDLPPSVDGDAMLKARLQDLGLEFDAHELNQPSSAARKLLGDRLTGELVKRVRSSVERAEGVHAASAEELEVNEPHLRHLSDAALRGKLQEVEVEIDNYLNILNAPRRVDGAPPGVRETLLQGARNHLPARRQSQRIYRALLQRRADRSNS